MRKFLHFLYEENSHSVEALFFTVGAFLLVISGILIIATVSPVIAVVLCFAILFLPAIVAFLRREK